MKFIVQSAKDINILSYSRLWTTFIFRPILLRSTAMENFCCLNKYAMHKTTIFIIQLCVVFELFVVKVVKRHFRLNFVTSRWV